jgi:hypothetical protein
MPQPASPSRHLNPSRRHLLLGAGASALLAACGGGGGGEAPAPAPPEGPIRGFSADKAQYFVGERAVLTASFTGAGRIEPSIGPLMSGVPVTTPVLDTVARFRLVVDTARGPVTRELVLPVGFRNRYQTVAATLMAVNHASVSVADGSVLILGGLRGVNAPTDDVTRVDPVTGSVTRIGSLRTGRYDHTATRLPDGRILVAAGGQGVQIGLVADVIDERTGAVSGGGSLNFARYWHADALLADGRVLLVGGRNRVQCEYWDPDTNLWRVVAQPMAHTREWATATPLADGRVLVAGGASSATNYRFAEIFDPRTETFTPVDAPGLEQRIWHTAHRMSDGSVLILGGSVVNSPTRAGPVRDVLRFDPATHRIDAVAPLATARLLARSVALPDDRVVLFGGQIEPDRHTETGEAYSTVAGGTPIAPAAQPRAWHSAHRLRDGRVLLFGGQDVDGNYSIAMQIFE